jgi:hypothetical protein
MKKFEVRKLTQTVLAVVIVSIFLATSCSDSKEIENLLGVRLPNDVAEVQYVKILGSEEFMKPYTSYIRAKMPEAAYRNMVNQLQLTLKSDEIENEYTILLLSQLRASRDTPSWWKPDPVANPLSSAGEFQNAQNDGWIVGTYNDGYGYFKIYEEGSP